MPELAAGHAVIEDLAQELRDGRAVGEPEEAASLAGPAIGTRPAARPRWPMFKLSVWPELKQRLAQELRDGPALLDSKDGCKPAEFCHLHTHRRAAEVKNA